MGTRTGRWVAGVAMAVLAAMLASCATMSARFAEDNRIVAAHALHVFRVGPVTLASTSSFALLDATSRPSHRLRSTYVFADAIPVTVKVTASDGLVERGFDREHAAKLARDLARGWRALAAYVGRDAPADVLHVRLADSSELVRKRTFSISGADAHTLTLAFRYDLAAGEDARRGITRTFAHELLHLALGVYGRNQPAGLEEERAATALEHCVELDVHGSTRRMQLSISENMGNKAIARSLAAAYQDDAEFDALFYAAEEERQQALRALCSKRAWALAGWR